MAKRFADTEIWKDPWYRKMPLEGKIFWKYLVDNCDPAGFWKKDFEMATFSCGFEVKDQTLDLLNNGKIRVIDYGEHIEISDFVHFQYGELSHDCNPHKPTLSLLSKYQSKGYLKGYFKGSDTLMDKDMDKEMDIVGVVKGVEYTPQFLEFWESYPRKTGKGAAFKAWKKIKGVNALANAIISSVQQHKISIQWKKDNGQFIPHPATYLNQRRWEDENTTEISDIKIPEYAKSYTK